MASHQFSCSVYLGNNLRCLNLLQNLELSKFVTASMLKSIVIFYISFYIATNKNNKLRDNLHLYAIYRHIVSSLKLGFRNILAQAGVSPSRIFKITTPHAIAILCIRPPPILQLHSNYKGQDFDRPV